MKTKIENLLRKFIKRRCELIVEESDVTEILKIVNRQTHDNVRIGDCGWLTQTSKWYVAFYTNEKIWNDIRTELREGDFKEIKYTLKDSFGRDVFQNI